MEHLEHVALSNPVWVYIYKKTMKFCKMNIKYALGVAVPWEVEQVIQ